MVQVGNRLRQQFVDTCTEHASAPALVDSTGTLTYGELLVEVAHVVDRLQELGADGPLGVHLPRGRRYVISVLAAVCDGRTYVPLPPDYPDDRLAHFHSTAGVTVVVTDDGGRARSAEVFDATPVLIPDDSPSDAAAASGRLADPSGTAHLAYTMFTSGSTGTPKGVSVSHDSVANLIDAGREFARLDQRPVVAHMANPAFGVSTFEIWGPLLSGGTIAIIDDPNPLAWGPRVVDVAAGRATVMAMTTSIFHQIARNKANALHGISTILFGGEVAAPDIIRSFMRSGFQGTLKNMYGSTEVTTIATGWPVRDEWVRSELDVVPVGCPIRGVVVGLRDEHGGPLDGTAVGQIVIGGAGVGAGYVGDDALTAERFTPDPAGVIDGTIYWTGDLGRWQEDGALVVVGRADRQTKVRGYRVEPGEIEAALRDHSGVTDAAVLAIGDNASRRLAAVVVLREGASTTEAELTDNLRRRLPSSMIPRQIKLVAQVPLTHNGKTDYERIRRLLAEG